MGSSMCLRGAGDVKVPAALVLPVSLLLFVPLAHALTFAPGQGWVHFLPQFGYGAVGGWVAVLVLHHGRWAARCCCAGVRAPGSASAYDKVHAHVRDAEDRCCARCSCRRRARCCWRSWAPGWSAARAPARARAAPAWRCSRRDWARCGCCPRRRSPTACAHAAEREPVLDLARLRRRAGDRDPRRRQRARGGARVRRRSRPPGASCSSGSPTAPISRTARGCRCWSRARPARRRRCGLARARLRRARCAGSRATRATPSRMRSTRRACCARRASRASCWSPMPRTSIARLREFVSGRACASWPAPTGRRWRPRPQSGALPAAHRSRSWARPLALYELLGDVARRVFAALDVRRQQADPRGRGSAVADAHADRGA